MSSPFPPETGKRCDACRHFEPIEPGSAAGYCIWLASHKPWPEWLLRRQGKAAQMAHEGNDCEAFEPAGSPR